MERDFPLGHPAAADYKGEAYVDRFASYHYDFPEGHPARGGKNVSALDTPDGARDAHQRQTNSLQTLAQEQALPPVFAPGAREPIPLKPEELAHVYAARLAANFQAPATTEERQALGYIVAHGYSESAAIEIFKRYTVPEGAAK